MYAIVTKTVNSVKTIATVESIDAAEEYLKANYNLVCFERDPDGHDAADAFAIQPGSRFGDVFSVERS